MSVTSETPTPGSVEQSSTDTVLVDPKPTHSTAAHLIDCNYLLVGEEGPARQARGVVHEHDAH